MSLPTIDFYSPEPENLQLAPMLDDVILESLFGSFGLPSLQHIPQFRNATQLEDPLLQFAPSSRDKDAVLEGANWETPNYRDGHATAGYHDKHAVPLAEVLNEQSPLSKFGRPSQETDPTSRRKIRRIEEECKDDTWQLPRPNVIKGLESAPLIPPLIQGIHEPPPNAGLIPSITDRPSNTLSRRAQLPDAPHGLPTRQLSQRPPVDLLPFRLDLNETQTLVSSKGSKRSSRSPQPSEYVKEAELKLDKRSQSAKCRNPWSDQETRALLQGVAKHGIGRWKMILASNENAFDNRTAVDLKDRFRVCRPQDYTSISNDPSEPPGDPSQNPGKSSRRDRTPQSRAAFLADDGPHGGTMLQPHKRSRRKTEVSLLEAGITEPLVRQERRIRHAFSAEEDAALLQGFETHGPKWKEILAQDIFNVHGRTARDLRDRFRNRWPERYEKAGLKPGGKGEERRRSYKDGM